MIFIHFLWKERETISLKLIYKNQINYIDWIELIKFRETRYYVQCVFKNYNLYRYALEQNPIVMKDFFKDEPLY